jgi:hypothetical protein
MGEAVPAYDRAVADRGGLVIYELRAEPEKFRGFEIVHEEEIAPFVDGFAGEPMADTWRTPEVRFWQDARGDELRGDFPSLVGFMPAFSGRAKESMGVLLEGAGEWLPLRCNEGDYWAFNVLAVADVMDEGRSQGEYLAPGRLLTLDKLALRGPASVAVGPIFKLPQWLKGSALVTQRFVDLVISARLTGLDLRVVMADR